MTTLNRLMRGYRPPLFGYLAAVCAAAVPVLALAGLDVARNISLETALEIAFFFLLALAADLRPIPLDEKAEHAVSLAFVFIVAASVLFGWEVAVLLAALSILVPHVAERRPPLRAAFNVATYALSASTTAFPALVLGSPDGNDLLRATACAFIGGGLYVGANVGLVSGAVALASARPFPAILGSNARDALGAFTVMAFLAALAASLWILEPPLIALLAGPLITVTLYQRSTLSSRIARHDAVTDSLTGLGNHRAYHESLRDAVEAANVERRTVSLCLLDLDDFKGINDRFGHPTGDEVLLSLAGVLGAFGDVQAFRLGGDEFALLVHGDENAAHAVAERVKQRLTVHQFPHRETIRLSVGIASYPTHAATADNLERVADGALYWSKRHGKDRTCVYSPSIVRVYSREELEREAEREARLRGAQSLVRVVDAKDSLTGNHSQTVSLLVEAIGRELGVDDEIAAQLRLAGLLHDLGKVGVPDAVLTKPGPLDPDEIGLIRTHPELGFSLLDGLDLEPVDRWILHHHEHWDGSGYPDGLAGNAIPIGSRIILVADAFEAMTADRPYRTAMSVEDALAELHRKAGVQFDPEVVNAFTAYLNEFRTNELGMLRERALA
jgi:diguanylate cyclase (GGDEF)-like protein